MPSSTQTRLTLVPFRGLCSFTKEESELFFGREGQSDELARKLGKKRFVAVVGSSGSGKSSLVRAGLLPSLDGGCLVTAGSDWRVVDMRPGGRPIGHLAGALERAGITDGPVDPEQLRNSSLSLIGLAQAAYSAGRLETDENILILVDQFEELFRYKSQGNSMEDRDEKAAFVKLLLEVSRQRELPIYVAITMRSEFLGDCARFRDLPEAINAGQFLIPRLNREQRRQAIEGPIRMAGGAIAPRLVQRILNEVGEDPGQLPVMQHALLRTWNYWFSKNQLDRPLDLEDYEAIGALEKAVSNHADEVYEEVRSKLPDRAATLVKRLFQRLSERDQYSRQTRRPTAMQELAEVCEVPVSQIEIAVNCFRQKGRSFLSTPDEQLGPLTEIDVTHECLLTKWDRLSKEWTPEEDESRRIYMRIATRALEEAVFDPDAGAVPILKSSVNFRGYLSGPGLDRAQTWWNQRAPNAAWARRYVRDEQGPMEASTIDTQFQLAKHYLIESKKHATRSRFLRFMSVPALAGVVFIIFAVWAYRQRSEIAIAHELLMKAELASNVAPHVLGFPNDDPRASALMAAQSLKHHATPDAQTILTQALFQLPQPLQPLKNRKAADAQFSPDGKWLVVAGEGGIDLYDANGKLSRSFPFAGIIDGSPKVIFANNKYFFTAINNKVSVWQFDDDKWGKVDDLTCEKTINRIAVNQYGGLIAAECGNLHFWTYKVSKKVNPDADCDRIASLAISPDGAQAAYVCISEKAWTLRLRQIDQSKKDSIVISDPSVVLSLAREQSNKTAPSTEGKNKSHPSPPEKHDPTEFWTSPKEVRDIRFDPSDSNVLIIAGSDGTVRSWRTRKNTAEKTATSLTSLDSFQESRPGIKSTSLYHSEEGNKLRTLPSSAEAIYFSEDGAWIAIAEANRVVKIWDTSEISGDQLVAHLALDHNVRDVAISRAGKHIAVVTDDGVVHLWRLNAGRENFPELSRLQAHGSYIVSHSVSSDVFSGKSRVIDTSDGRTVASFPGTIKAVNPSYRPLTVSLDGRFIAGMTTDAMVVHEFSNGKIEKEKWRQKFSEASIYMTSFAFSLDNHFLIGAVGDATSLWFEFWDVTKADSPALKIPGEVGDSYDILPGTGEVFLSNAKTGLRKYTPATKQTTSLDWGKHLVLYGFDPLGKGAAGVEMRGQCNTPPESESPGKAQAKSEEQTGTFIRIFDAGEDKERNHFELKDYCIQNFELSMDSRYLLTLAATPEEQAHPTVVQLWDVAAHPAALMAEIRNWDQVKDISITRDLRIALLDQKQFALVPWQTETLKRDFCARMAPNSTEDKDYSQVCSSTPPLLGW